MNCLSGQVLSQVELVDGIPTDLYAFQIVRICPQPAQHSTLELVAMSDLRMARKLYLIRFRIYIYAGFMNFDCDNFASGIQSVFVIIEGNVNIAAAKNESASMIFTHNKSANSSLNCVDFKY